MSSYTYPNTYNHFEVHLWRGSKFYKITYQIFEQESAQTDSKNYSKHAKMLIGSKHLSLITVHSSPKSFFFFAGFASRLLFHWKSILFCFMVLKMAIYIGLYRRLQMVKRIKKKTTHLLVEGKTVIIQLNSAYARGERDCSLCISA